MKPDEPIHALTARPTRVGFVLLPRYTLMAYAAALEPLRVANRMYGGDCYRWLSLSADGGPVTGSGGVVGVVDGALDAAPKLDMVVIVASYQPEAAATRRVLKFLHLSARKGCVLVGVDTGSYVLAMAGLLDGYRATVHWEHLEPFAERFPRVKLSEELFVMDRLRWSAAGGTACMDLMLDLIARQHGAELAAAVSDQFIYARMRKSGDVQRMPAEQRGVHRNARLMQALARMQDALEEPLTIRDVARGSGVSVRELERLFARWLGRTPGAHYRRLRLERARQLLQATSRPVTDVAMACGFASLAVFSRSYKREFGIPPGRDRSP